jgi:acyl-[acyl-carrier-protein]-phospholipid O-acyltransferase/long-chain-fatty-acid--[acyl-carrier-protein] ligase
VNFVGELWTQIGIMRRDRALWLANLGNTWFFFLAALLQMNLFVHARDALHLTDTQSGLLQAALAIGIGAGSACAGFASRGHIEYGLIPLGAIGLALAGAALSCPGLGAVPTGWVLAFLGFGGGFFIVPVSALLQHRPQADNKGGVLAASNLMSFIGIFMASGVDYLLATALHLGPRAIFLVCAVFTAITTGFIIHARPAALPGFFRNLVKRQTQAVGEIVPGVDRVGV